MSFRRAQILDRGNPLSRTKSPRFLLLALGQEVRIATFVPTLLLVESILQAHLVLLKIVKGVSRRENFILHPEDISLYC